MNFEQLDQIRTCTSRERLAALVLGVANDMGFPLFSVEVGFQSGLYDVINNVPRDFAVQASDYADLQRDPLTKLKLAMRVPFAYDRKTYLCADADDLWTEQAEYGYRTGVVVPVRIPGGAHFVFGVDRPSPLPPLPIELDRLFRDVQLVALHAYEAAQDIMLRAIVSPTKMAATAPRLPDVKLTRREIECLHYAGRGMTDSITGRILGISDRTVRKHIETAMLKFGAANRIEAAVLADRLGLTRSVGR